MSSNQSVKVLVTRNIPEIGVDLLRKEGYDVTVMGYDKPLTADELLQAAKKADALLCLGSNKIDEVFLHECKHLQVISQFAVGYDNINVPVATKLGIPVGNTPEVLSDATADIAFGLMIAVSRKFFYLHNTISKGEWGFFQPKKNLGIELKNKTLGVFGLGRIGTEMARRCKGAYHMTVIYHSRNRNVQAEKELNAKWVSFDELLQQSDVLSVHSVLSEETKGIFNKAAFGKMKPSAIFINTSRGGVHNEADLIDALTTKTIWGAGLDVTNPEPMQKDNPLLFMENAAVLPHIGSGTVEARNAMSQLAAENIIAFYKTGTMKNCVNPEVLLRK
ncbi:MAG: D-glycerate dehydrogenase [Azospira oryzae]|nr:MAG: D-glycerate dehydrogenase [Azospira oryzae]